VVRKLFFAPAAAALMVGGLLATAPASAGGDPADRVRPPADIVLKGEFAISGNATIVDFNTVRLQPTLGNFAEVVITDLGFTVNRGDKITFAMKLSDGAVCQPFSPQIYAYTEPDVFFSSFGDATPCGGETPWPSTQNGKVSFLSPETGSIEEFGIYSDGGTAGTYEVSNIKIDGHLVLFNFRPITADLTAANTRTGDDKLVVRTRPAWHANGARVDFFKVVDGDVRKLDSKKANRKGIAALVVNDRNNKKAARYRVEVHGTRDTTGALSNPARVR
jgi:hypothetical protein